MRGTQSRTTVQTGPHALIEAPPLPHPSTPPYPSRPLGNGLWRAAAASPGALIRYLLLSFTWAPQGGRAGLQGGGKDGEEERNGNVGEEGLAPLEPETRRERRELGAQRPGQVVDTRAPGLCGQEEEVGLLHSQRGPLPVLCSECPCEFNLCT